MIESLLTDEILYAAFIGAVVSALRFSGRSKAKMLRVFLTGYFFAVFTGEDIMNGIQQYLSFKVSQGGVVFMVAFLGAEVLERTILFIRSMNVNMIWNKKDDN